MPKVRRGWQCEASAQSAECRDRFSASKAENRPPATCRRGSAESDPGTAGPAHRRAADRRGRICTREPPVRPIVRAVDIAAKNIMLELQNFPVLAAATR